MTFVLKRFVHLLATICVPAALLVASGCGGSGGGVVVGKNPFVIFVNASSNAGTLLFSLNDEPKGGNLAPLKSSAPVQVEFISNEDGGYDVAVEATDRSDIFDSQVNTFDRDSSTVVAAFGLKAFGTEDEKRLRLAILSVDRTAPTGNRARFIVLHGYNLMAGFDTPAINFLSADPTDPDNLDNPQFSLTDIEYGTVRAIEVDVDPNPANHLVWVVRRADAEARLSTPVAPNPAIKAGGIYLVIVSGLEDADADTRDATVTFVPIPPNE